MKDLRSVLFLGTGKFLIASVRWGMGFTVSSPMTNPDQETSFKQNWNFSGFCWIPFLPISVRYSAVCLKFADISVFQRRLSSTCLILSLTSLVILSNLLL